RVLCAELFFGQLLQALDRHAVDDRREQLLARRETAAVGDPDDVAFTVLVPLVPQADGAALLGRQQVSLVDGGVEIERFHGATLPGRRDRATGPAAPLPGAWAQAAGRP